MLGIRPYRSGDAAVIIRWCADEDAFFKWTAGRMGPFPLTEERLQEALAGRFDNDRFFPFVAVEDERVVGFFILRRPGEDPGVLRFGFVIVDPLLRGKGYGKRMLRLGMRYAFEIYGAERVTLGVFEDNPPACHCYQAAGFTILPEKEIYEGNGRQWVCIEMAAEREPMT